MSRSSQALPRRQYAVQLVGPSKLKLNRRKEVVPPGPFQVLAKVEAVGLCFSDLKLLKQFARHTRKGEIVSGISKEILEEIPSYVPGGKPAVPGHEAVCRIVAVGQEVRHHGVGERCLVQTDYRWLRTATSNAAFGYNFEGALQEYVLMDERIIMDPETGERLLIPVSEDPGASAVCLVEPWACVEESYVNPERRTIRPNGKLLVVADAGREITGLAEAFSPDGKPSTLTAICAEDPQRQAVRRLGVAVSELADPGQAADEAFDDVVYFGVRRDTLEVLNDKLAPGGIIAIVTAGGRIGEPVSVGVGRVHYGMKRWAGTTSAVAAEAYQAIPENGEIRPAEKIIVIGAGGPMGQMHVIRDACSGVADIAIVATDLDDARLEALAQKARPLADANGARLRTINPQKQPLDEKFSYFALMVPAAEMVADAVRSSTQGCLINIFAGIPAAARCGIDLDRYIANRCYMFGTSGSVVRDMRIVLGKMESGRLDTDCSVGAVSGMAGAIEGMAAVENRKLAGKIIVYPSLREMGLIPLSELSAHVPSVAEKLDRGSWCKAAEEELLKVAMEPGR